MVYQQLTKLNISFIFTLYPGGGFNLKSEEVKKNLILICGSPQFKGVVVTQKVSRDYLLENEICSADKIYYIFGGIVPQNSIDCKRNNYFIDVSDKVNELNICFCASKYMDRGMDKGYDIFIDVAHKLIEEFDYINFHVVGGFDENDINVEKIKKNVHFHGYKKFEELKSFFANMDIILSPNRPNLLEDGLFVRYVLDASSTFKSSELLYLKSRSCFCISSFTSVSCLHNKLCFSLLITQSSIFLFNSLICLITGIF